MTKEEVNLKLIKELNDKGYDAINMDFNLLNDFADILYKAINYTHCCEKLKDKETPTLKDAFIAGYKKRALMSGLKYDEVSELNAITNFKCWKSFDINL